jgi:quercetin dioxygenase-like cupin family protein
MEDDMALRHALPGEVVDLLKPRQELGRTAAIVKSSSFEAVRLVVNAGNEIPSHQVEGPITLQCVSGRTIVGFESSQVEIQSGQWLYLEGGIPHWLRGIEDSVLVLTILFGKRAEDPRLTEVR